MRGLIFGTTFGDAPLCTSYKAQATVAQPKTWPEFMRGLFEFSRDRERGQGRAP